MNKNFHRIVFNAARGLRMVVQETARSTGRGTSKATARVANGAAVGLVSAVATLASASLHAQISVDPTAPGSQRPTAASNAPGDWFRQSNNVAGTFLSQNYRVAYTTGPGTRAADISSAVNLIGTLEVQPKIKMSAVDNASSTIGLAGSTELTVIYP